MYIMKTFFRHRILIVVSLLAPGILGLTGCQVVDSYANRMINLFARLLTSLTEAIRFPSFR